MHKRFVLYSTVSIGGMVLIGLLLFFVLHSVSIPCLFHQLTGWDCPGCGMTRSVISLAHGHWIQALRYNLFSIPLLFLFFLYWFQFGKYYIKTGKRLSFEQVFSKTFTYLFLICFLVYGVARNF